MKQTSDLIFNSLLTGSYHLKNSNFTNDSIHLPLSKLSDDNDIPIVVSGTNLNQLAKLSLKLTVRRVGFDLRRVHWLWVECGYRRTGGRWKHTKEEKRREEKGGKKAWYARLCACLRFIEIPQTSNKQTSVTASLMQESHKNQVGSCPLFNHWQTVSTLAWQGVATIDGGSCGHDLRCALKLFGSFPLHF